MVQRRGEHDPNPKLSDSRREGGSQNRTFHLSPEAQTFFSTRMVPGAQDGVSRADILHSVLAGFRILMARHLPDLSKEEWALICDSLDHRYPGPETLFYPVVFEVKDAIELNKLDEKWGVHASKLIETLTSLPPEANLAVYDLVSRFWAQQGTPEASASVFDRITDLVAETKRVRPHRGTLLATPRS